MSQSEPPLDDRTSLSRRRPILIALLVVMAAALWTRAPAPWRLGVTNDEMHHLQSWRNRYGTDDIFPLFLTRIHETHAMSGAKLHFIEQLYHRSTLFQHGLLILIDPQPPVFPTLGEILAATTRSNLVALRLPSMLASLLGIYLMFRIGLALRDAALGGWMAALMVVTELARVYAGIGRPYALAQCAVIATVYAYVLDQGRSYRSPWRFLLCALWAQATQWPAWLVISPMVLAVLWKRIETGEKPIALFRQAWWYVLVSVGLLGELVIQLHNPTIDKMSGRMAWSVLLEHLALGAPLGVLVGFGHHALVGLGWGVLITSAIGLILLLASKTSVIAPLRRVRYVLAVMAVFSLLGLYGAGSPLRFMNTYGIALVLLTAFFLRGLFQTESMSALGMIGLIGVGVILGIVHPLSPYDYAFPHEQSYPAVARALSGQLQPGDTWTAYPYFRADCLYPYASLPEPIVKDQFADINQYIVDRKKTGVCYLYVVDPAVGEVPSFASLSRQDFSGDSILLKYGPEAQN